MEFNVRDYYEKNLKGKDKKQILLVIRALKYTISQIKNMMEHPGYSSYSDLYYIDKERIQIARSCLEKAKEELIAVGGTYTLSPTELKDQDFQENVEFINRISLQYKISWLNSEETYIAVLKDDKFHIKSRRPINIPNWDGTEKEDYIVGKQFFLESMRDLHIGEWKTKYMFKNFNDVDVSAEPWELNIEFSNGHNSVRIQGVGAEPYNIHQLKSLMDEYDFGD